jgi:hypothetical protein
MGMGGSCIRHTAAIEGGPAQIEGVGPRIRTVAIGDAGGGKTVVNQAGDETPSRLISKTPRPLLFIFPAVFSGAGILSWIADFFFSRRFLAV